MIYLSYVLCCQKYEKVLGVGKYWDFISSLCSKTIVQSRAISLRPVSELLEVNNTDAFNLLMSTQYKTSCHELTPVEQVYLVGKYDADESFG